MAEPAGVPHVEVEIKLEADADATVPDLAGLPGVFEVRRNDPDELDAVYYDTPDLDLIRAGITLRRRRGGPDEGWHLKLPPLAGLGAGGARLEVHRPLGRGEVVPAQLLSLVRARLLGRQVAPVARIHTRRTRYDLLGADGALLAEVADDEVGGEAFPAGPTPEGGFPGSRQRWREIEVELGTADRGLLDAARDLLTTLARPAPAPSKLARILRERIDRAPAGAPGRREARPGSVPAAVGPAGVPAAAGPAMVALERIGAEFARLVALDPQVRLDRPDAIHQMRVATRRLRSQLATFRPLFDRVAVEHLRRELAWLGAALGAARDAEVMHAHLLALLDDEPLVIGPVRRRIDTELDREYRAAHLAAVQALNSPRHLDLLSDIETFLLAPRSGPRLPASIRLPEPAPLASELTTLVARTHARLVEAVGRVDGGDSPGEREVLWHEVRKAAKRSRYAAEAVAGVAGRAAIDYAAAAERVQTLLGDGQDAVVVRAMLLTLSRRAAAAGENAFTYGRLHSRLEGRAGERERQVRTALATLTEAARTWPG